MPKVSLVMTVRNREQYLCQAIESVLTQTYQDFELLVWDDGSTDDSVEIARHYAAQDSRISAIAVGVHLGRSPALKAAHAVAKGIYVGWVDSDDLLAPTALDETVKILDARSEVGLVYTDYQVIDESSQIKGYGQRCQTPYSQETLLTGFITFHFRLMRRQFYELVGGIDPDFEVCQDYDLCLKISEVTEIHQLKRPLYYYRSHKDSISGQKRLQQIQWGSEAIGRALVRRGLDAEYELDVEILARCTLLKKVDPLLSINAL